MPRTRQLNRVVFHLHLGDRARGGAHAHGNPRSLESRSGRRRGAQQALAIANHDLSIRAQIHQPVQILAFTEVRGQNAGQNIAAHEPAQAREKTHARLAGELPPQIPGAESLEAELLRLERVPRERLNIQPAEKVVHHGVAHHHYIRDFPFRNLGGKHQLLDQASDLLANQIAELLRAAFRHGKLHAAHDVGPKARLGVERRAHRQHAAGAEVKQLGDQRGGSQVHRHAQAGARLERQRASHPPGWRHPIGAAR